jgi:hypothetical protein
MLSRTFNLGLGHERLTRDDRVNRPGKERGRHVRRRHFQESHIADAHPSLPQRLVDDQPLIGKPVRHGDLSAAQVFDTENRRVIADHHRRAVTVAEIDDLDRHPLLAQRHGQRGEDEGRLEVVRQKRLLQLGPAAEPDGLDQTVSTDLFVDEVSDRTGQVAGHRDETDSKRCFAVEFPPGGAVE